MGGMVCLNSIVIKIIADSVRLEDLQLPKLQPKKAFIVGALDKEIRLSFAKRIRSTLPEDMHTLIPQRLDEDNSPDFKYDNKRKYCRHCNLRCLTRQ